MGNTGILRVLRCGNDVEAFRELGQLIAVRHPDLHVVLKSLEQAVDMSVNSLRLKVRMSILAYSTCDN